MGEAVCCSSRWDCIRLYCTFSHGPGPVCLAHCSGVPTLVRFPLSPPLPALCMHARQCRSRSPCILDSWVALPCRIDHRIACASAYYAHMPCWIVVEGDERYSLPTRMLYHIVRSHHSQDSSCVC
ncbi:hypothetical protein BD310DRAFT_942250 [Dichomitus squalens]|uniref:Uncharacterized protein n=1 Tax=Dichomitus squalens TaxID=114155 RepID=A0A4Q9PG71_9APHY|nr:hypothetical protein BD310DRAFT_942250 [Dichomitus squalens]